MWGPAVAEPHIRLPGCPDLADDPSSQPYLAAAVGIQSQTVEFPVTVLGVVGQHAPRRVAGYPARHIHVLKFVFRHRIHCAGDRPVRIASALCLMSCSPPWPRYEPPPRRSKQRSTATLARSRTARVRTT